MSLDRIFAAMSDFFLIILIEYIFYRNILLCYRKELVEKQAEIDAEKREIRYKNIWSLISGI